MYRQVYQVNQNIGKNPKIDASFEGVGAVLSQKRPNGKIVLIHQHHSESLKGIWKN